MSMRSWLDDYWEPLSLIAVLAMAVTVAAWFFHAEDVHRNATRFATRAGHCPETLTICHGKDCEVECGDGTVLVLECWAGPFRNGCRRARVEEPTP